MHETICFSIGDNCGLNLLDSESSELLAVKILESRVTCDFQIGGRAYCDKQTEKRAAVLVV